MARRRDEERWRYWRRVFEEHRSSGLSIAAFCRERDLSPASFYSWRRKIAASPGEHGSTDNRWDSPSSSRPLFVSVPLTDSVRQGEPFEVQLRNGIRVRVPPQFDETALANLLQKATSIKDEHA